MWIIIIIIVAVVVLKQNYPHRKLYLNSHRKLSVMFTNTLQGTKIESYCFPIIWAVNLWEIPSKLCRDSSSNKHDASDWGSCLGEAMKPQNLSTCLTVYLSTIHYDHLKNISNISGLISNYSQIIRFVYLARYLFVAYF